MVLKGGFDFADYHPAIGVVLFSFVWTQPISGLAHHCKLLLCLSSLIGHSLTMHSEVQTSWRADYHIASPHLDWPMSHHPGYAPDLASVNKLELMLNITPGMIQGGLGILYAGGHDPTTGENIAYGVVAAVIWLVYIAVVVYELAFKKHGAPESRGEKLAKNKNIESRGSTTAGSSAAELPGAFGKETT